jgi:undecaprenyl-diphosphatase
MKGFNITMRILLTIVLFIASVSALGLIIHDVFSDNLTVIDTLVIEKVKKLHSPCMTTVMKFITFFGSSWFLVPAYCAIALYYYFIKKNKKLVFDILAVYITGRIVLLSAKYYFQRQRPEDTLIGHLASFSFPSGHSFSAFTFFGLLIYVSSYYSLSFFQRLAVIFLSFTAACLIAFSRVYLGVHFPSDVIAGFCLCIVWLIISFSVLNNIKLSDKDK